MVGFHSACVTLALSTICLTLLTTALEDQEGKIIAEILRSYRDLVNFATEPITNKSSTGQASYNSMAMDLETQSLVST